MPLGTHVRRWKPTEEVRDWATWDLEHPYVPEGKDSGDGTTSSKSDGQKTSDPLSGAFMKDPNDDYDKYEEISKTFEDAKQIQHDSLTPTENGAVSAYTSIAGIGYGGGGSPCEIINGGLRGITPLDGGSANVVKQLDGVFAEHSFALSTDQTLYRGVNGAVDVSMIHPGSVLQDAAYLSTSSSENTAVGFSQLPVSGQRQGYVIELSAPAGSRYIVGEPSERELIQPRNTPMVVDRVDMDAQYGMHNVPRVYAHLVAA